MQAKGLNAWQLKTIATVAMAIPHAVPDSPGLLRSGLSGQLKLHRRHLDSGLRPVPEGPGKKMGLLRLLPHPPAGPAPAPCGAVKLMLWKPPSPAKTSGRLSSFLSQPALSIRKNGVANGSPAQRVCSLPGSACLPAWRKKAPPGEFCPLRRGSLVYLV